MRHTYTRSRRDKHGDHPRIDDIVIHRETDTTADLSELGNYGDEPKDHCIICYGEHKSKFVGDLGEDDELPERSREYRFFEAYAGGEKPDLRPDSEYRKYALQDYERMTRYNKNEWCYVGVYAEAEVSYPISSQGDRRVERFSSGGLWHIESDSDESYFSEVEQEQLDDLKRHLAKFGVTEGWDKAAKKAKADNACR